MALEQQLIHGLEALRWEWVATALALIFLLLALGRQRGCWLFAALSAAVSFGIHWRQNSTLSLLLNGAYLLIVAYGWWRWRRPSIDVVPGRLCGAARVYLVATALAMTLVAGFWADHYALARAPYAEAFIVSSALGFLGLLAYQYIECWYCLLLSEAVSVTLALQAGAQTSASLHCWYMALAMVGIGLWVNVIRALPGDSAAQGDRRGLVRQ